MCYPYVGKVMTLPTMGGFVLYQESSTAMQRFSSPRVRIALGAAIVLLITILAVLYAPPEGQSNNVSGDLPPGTPTIVVTNQLASAAINRNIEFQDVSIAIENATLAKTFSDDRKRNGIYTLRVEANAINKGNAVLGVNYASLVYLVLPNGQKVPTKLISIAADALPGQLQSGFFDFPLSTPVPLADLKIEFEGGPVVPLQAV
jgi:hypothetical protein